MWPLGVLYVATVLAAFGVGYLTKALLTDRRPDQPPDPRGGTR